MSVPPDIYGLQLCTKCRYAIPIKLHPGQFQCHRSPPTPFAVQAATGIGSMSFWPTVTKDDACGEGLPKIMMSE
jgi:hypothetical protein